MYKATFREKPKRTSEPTQPRKGEMKMTKFEEEFNYLEEEVKKGTKEEIIREINEKIFVLPLEIRSVLDSLEEQGYIKFKKEPKEYKVFVKIVTIGEEQKKLYYVTDYHLTENIDEAKRFEINEDKDGYGYERIKESI